MNNKFKRKVIIKILIIICLLSFTIIIPVSYSKYVLKANGTAQVIKFSDSSVITTDTFVIDQEALDEEGEVTSENLWGSSGTYDSDYQVTKISNVEIPVINKTNQNLLVIFEIDICAYDGLGSGVTHYSADMHIENLTLNERTNEFTLSTKTDSSDVPMTKGSKAYTKSFLTYYHFTCEINPSNFLQSGKTVYDGFIIPAGTEVPYIYSLKGSSSQLGGALSSNTYASIKIKVIPYNP